MNTIEQSCFNTLYTYQHLIYRPTQGLFNNRVKLRLRATYPYLLYFLHMA